MANAELEALEQELDQDETVDTKISSEDQKKLYVILRNSLLVEFHKNKVNGRVSRKVGDHQTAEHCFTEAKKVLKMISALDEEAATVGK